MLTSEQGRTFDFVGDHPLLNEIAGSSVQCVVTAQSGSARVSATAIGSDNVTGATQAIALTPTAGSASPSVSLVTPVFINSPTSPTRRRAVRH
jgi:hypothetical protein